MQWNWTKRHMQTLQASLRIKMTPSQCILHDILIGMTLEFLNFNASHDTQEQASLAIQK